MKWQDVSRGKWACMLNVGGCHIKGLTGQLDSLPETSRTLPVPFLANPRVWPCFGSQQLFSTWEELNAYTSIWQNKIDVANCKLSPK